VTFRVPSGSTKAVLKSTKTPHALRMRVFLFETILLALNTHLSEQQLLYMIDILKAVGIVKLVFIL